MTADKFEHVAGDALRELGELARALLGAKTVDGVLRRVVVSARLLLPRADVVSITLRRNDGSYYTPAETDPEALELDRLQYAFDEGPCLDAADPDGPAYAHSGDLSTETAWPDFARGTAAHGFYSILSTALLSGPEPAPFTGALNVYSRQRDSLDLVARDTAFLLATYASLAVSAAFAAEHADQTLTEARTEVINLKKALETRTVIGQATGILMARRGITDDEAIEALSRASQNHNIKLTHLAKLLAAHPHAADRL